MFFFFFFKQKTAYEMRISDWSSDVCSSDLNSIESWAAVITTEPVLVEGHTNRPRSIRLENRHMPWPSYQSSLTRSPRLPRKANSAPECGLSSRTCCVIRSEEHTSELQSLMRISYAVFCLKKKKPNTQTKQLIKRHNTT